MSAIIMEEVDNRPIPSNMNIEQVDHQNFRELEEGETSYAKLFCNNEKVFYMRELELEIGRDNTRENDPKYFQLTNLGTLSKNHAKIFWDKDAKVFKIKNMSKNKIFVNFVELTADEPPAPLFNMCPIMMAKIKLYFLLPQDQ